MNHLLLRASLYIANTIKTFKIIVYITHYAFITMRNTPTHNPIYGPVDAILIIAQ